MNSKQQKLWQEYLRQERGKIRHLYLTALDTFVQEMEDTPVHHYRSWAADLAERVVDRNETIPVRMPLFERVLFPALLSGYIEHLPGYARWLAGFSHLLYHCKSCREALEGPATKVALLRRALDDDPSDELALLRLVRELGDGLDYAVHEVPAGVLWGQHGARIDECRELRKGLTEFEQLATRSGVLEEYAELIAECRLHFQAYENYLRHRKGMEQLRSVPGRDGTEVARCITRGSY